LQKIPLFREVSLEEFKKGGSFYPLLSLVHEQRCGIGEDIFRQGQRASRLYYVVEGRLRLTRVDADAVTRYLQTLGPGESVGETGLLIGDFHDATAEALVPTHLLYLEQEEFKAFLEEEPRARRLLNFSREVERRLEMPHFEWLRNDEMVIFTARRHWSYLFRRVAPTFTILLLALLAMLVSLQGALFEAFASWVAVVMGVVVVFLAGFIGWQWINWRDDFFVLTTQRVVHSERIWPVRKRFEEGALSNIQETYVLQSGFVANALNYGDLILQTAGEKVEIDLTGVGRPLYLKDLIVKELERTRARQLASLRGNIRAKLKERLETGRLPLEQSSEDSAAGVTSRGLSPFLAVKSLFGYFFPPSRLESADGRTIYWRRYWLPGFFQNWHILLLWLGWTVGGILFSTRLISTLWLLFGWLVVEGVLFGVLLWRIEDWRNDYFELSPGRIMLVSQRPLLLERSRREARLEDIQNLGSETPNVLGQFFRYGHVTFETAGETGQFELKWVRFPEEVRNEISRRQQMYEAQQREANARRRQDELLQWFDVYDELRNSGQRRPTPRANMEEMDDAET